MSQSLEFTRLQDLQDVISKLTFSFSAGMNETKNLPVVCNALGVINQTREGLEADRWERGNSFHTAPSVGTSGNQQQVDAALLTLPPSPSVHRLCGSVAFSAFHVFLSG